MEKPSSMIRAFVAIAVPATPPLRKLLHELDAMGSAIKAVSERQLHITLKFLGDVAPNRLPDVESELNEIAKRYTVHRVQLIGVGAFPHARRPSVIWVGMQPGESLKSMAGGIDESLQRHGFEPERREFSPHLTLARVKFRPPDELLEIIESHQQSEFGAFDVGEISLYASELKPRGPVYRVLRSFPLSATE